MRIAIPSKGRLKPLALQALQTAGITVIQKERTYVSQTSDPTYEVVFARAFDIPIYVHYGAVDLGITGHDLILEREVDVHELVDFGFGKCQLVIAAPNDSPINAGTAIPSSARVATEYPNITQKYFDGLGKQVDILKMDGTSELAPRLGLAQIIIDITSSGETLRKNKLKIIETILDSTCRLACNKIAYRIVEYQIKELVNNLRQ